MGKGSLEGLRTSRYPCWVLTRGAYPQSFPASEGNSGAVRDGEMGLAEVGGRGVNKPMVGFLMLLFD